MKKQKREKIKNVWNKIKKPLMIFSIIGNILFLMVIIVGCSNQGKSKSLSVHAEDQQRVTDLTDTTWVFNENNGSPRYLNSSYFDTAVEYFSINFQSNEQVFNYAQVQRDERGASRINYKLGDTWLSPEVWRFGYGWSNYNYRTIHINDGNAVTSQKLIDFLYLNAVLQVQPEPAPEPGSQEHILESIYLSDSFIPITYVTQNGDYMFSGFAGKNSSAETHIVHLTGLTFLSNGETFNTISLFYAPLNAVTSRITQDGQTLIDTTSYGDYLCCIAIKYQYIIDNQTISNVTVCSPRRTLIVSEAYNYNVFDVRPPFNVWVNENYRKIDVLEDDGTIQNDSLLTITNKTTFQLLKVTSNVSQDVMGFANVFTLMSSAFAGLASILGISILPGITIGLLLFIPLIVVIIISVIKIIKK